MGSLIHYYLEIKTDWNDSFNERFGLHFLRIFHIFKNTGYKLLIVSFLGFTFARAYGLQQYRHVFLIQKVMQKKGLF